MVPGYNAGYLLYFPTDNVRLYHNYFLFKSLFSPDFTIVAIITCLFPLLCVKIAGTSIIGGSVKMNAFTITLLVIIAFAIISTIVLYFVGKKAQKKQDEQREIMEANKQTVSMLIIDKKRMKIKDSGLHQSVIDQTPKYMRWSKLPIVKAKVGPQILSLISDERIFDNIPVKKEVKAVVSGIYIMDVKGLHGKNDSQPKKKKGFFKRLVEKAQEKAGAKPIK